MDLKIGHRIKALRHACDLTQAELADRADLTKGFISQFENDQCSISVDSLADMLDVLGMSMTEFFAEEDTPGVVFSLNDRVSIDGRGAAKFEMLIPGSTNNEMDPIMLEMSAGEELAVSDPHPGEQFGYILSGTLTLKLGDRDFRVPAKHCFSFKSDQPHQMLNTHSSPVKVLWITTPPQM